MRSSAFALASSLVVIGAGALVAPKRSSVMYGLAVADRNGCGFVRATGARDVILGCAILAGIDDERRTDTLLALTAVVAAADAVILAATRGPRPQHLAHLAGGILFALASRTRT